MRTVRRVIVAALFVAVWYFGWRFATENSATLSIHLLAIQLEGVSVWVALICAFAGGGVVTGAVMTLVVARTKLVARRYRKAVVGLEAELHQLRNLPLSVEPPAGRVPAPDLDDPVRTLERGA